ncbi:hypothetical protein ABZ951_15020 [Streptomyces sp. NPDC046215]|uniref:hypothetical protein n=1 Tax=Streptomyces TaxID=1883 RepID=UPI0031DFBCFF
MTTPLTQLADEELERAAGAVTTLTGRLAACDTDLARCQREAADATGALAALVAEEAGIRRDLGAAPLPVDADGLARTLEELLVERQRAVAEAARSADALGAVQRGRTALTDALTLAQGRLAKATDAAKKAQEDADQVAAWVGAVRARSAGKASPGTDPKRGGAAQKTEDAAGTSDATAQKTEGPAQKTEGPAQKDESPAQKPESPAQKAGTAAQSSDGAAQRPDGAAPPPADGSLDGARGRLDALFGAALFKLFRIRAVEAGRRTAAVTDRLDRAHRARRKQLADRGDPAGALLGAQDAYAGALAALRAAAEGASTRHDEARSRLDAVARAQGPTSAQKEQLKRLRRNAQAAAPKEEAVYAAAQDLREAEAALDTAVLAAIDAEPDLDAETSPRVAEEREAVTAAERELREKREELAGAQAALDSWEAAIPEDLKEQVLTFLAAEAALDGPGGTDGDAEKLIKNVYDARDALAHALREASKAADAADRLTAELTSRAADAEAAHAVATARRAALVRGEA